MSRPAQTKAKNFFKQMNCPRPMLLVHKCYGTLFQTFGAAAEKFCVL